MNRDRLAKPPTSNTEDKTHTVLMVHYMFGG